MAVGEILGKIGKGVAKYGKNLAQDFASSKGYGKGRSSGGSRKLPSLSDMKDTSGATDTSGDSYKKGGKVRRTGMAKVHKGERVLTKKQAKRYSKSRGK